MTPAKTAKKKAKESAPEVELSLEKEESLELQILEKYQGWTSEQLDAAWREARGRLEAVEEKVAGADETLNEAAKRDAAEFGTAGLAAWEEAENFRHFDAAQKKVSYLLIARWGLTKTTSELEYAYRIVKDRELVAELEARAPEVAEAEEAFREAEKRLNELRGQQNDVQQERRMLKDGVVYVRDRLVQALEGPGFRSAGR